MSIEWTGPQMVASTLGEKFVKQVLERMPSNSTVRFGETGEGVFPNYQIETETGVRALWRGKGHSEWPQGVTKFDAGKVSIAFSKRELHDAFTAKFRSARNK